MYATFVFQLDGHINIWWVPVLSDVPPAPWARWSEFESPLANRVDVPASAAFPVSILPLGATSARCPGGWLTWFTARALAAARGLRPRDPGAEAGSAPRRDLGPKRRARPAPRRTKPKHGGGRLSNLDPLAAGRGQR